MYFGCPISHVKKKKQDFIDLMKKVQNKLYIWKGKLLFFGAKTILIYRVLQSMSICLLSVIIPPKYVIKYFHRVFALFLLNFSKHWVYRTNICLPKEEGGLGFRPFFDVNFIYKVVMEF